MLAHSPGREAKEYGDCAQKQQSERNRVVEHRQRYGRSHYWIFVARLPATGPFWTIIVA
jgi:hypothetical protein